MTEQKSREFWITVFADGIREIFDIPSEEIGYKTKHHVIEFHAYQSVLDELKAVKEDLDDENDRVAELQTKVEVLKGELYTENELITKLQNDIQELKALVSKVLNPEPKAQGDN